MFRIESRKNWVGILAVTLIMTGIQKAQAVPSFARQTGMSCAMCHTVFPELTSFGRTFKLNGYVLNNSKKVKETAAGKEDRLSLNDTPPVAAMIQIAETLTQTPPGNTVSNGSDKNGQLEFPSQFSLFYAGAISPKMGAFVQVTYDSASGSFGFDNTDVRLADQFTLGDTDLTVGLTANNNPTVQDVFNSTPAWGFPFSGSNTAITPSASSQLESLGGAVGGLGLYAFWNNLVYAEISGYRTAPQGGPAAADIQGFAPYWRVALAQDLDEHSIEVGAYGMDQRTYPDGADPTLAPSDDISDFALDGQYQFVGKDHIITVHGNCIWEKQTWNYSQPNGTATNPTDNFQVLRADATYYYDRKIGATVGYFTTTGSTDALLYPTGTPVSGFAAANVPDSEGWLFEMNYMPWYNTKFSLQYTAYSKFNGGTSNYDGSGRNAGDNNTLMAMAWLMY
jgi:hypothetical protein